MLKNKGMTCCDSESMGSLSPFSYSQELNNRKDQFREACREGLSFALSFFTTVSSYLMSHFTPKTCFSCCLKSAE